MRSAGVADAPLADEGFLRPTNSAPTTITASATRKVAPSSAQSLGRIRSQASPIDARCPSTASATTTINIPDSRIDATVLTNWPA